MADGTLVAITPAAQFTNLFGDPTLVFPYVVYRVSADDQIDAQTTRVENVNIEFWIYDKAENGRTNCQTILTRLIGDWPAQSTRVPSFGFDRWVPDLSSAGWGTGGMFKTGESTQHEVDVLCYTITFRCTASFTA